MLETIFHDTLSDFANHDPRSEDARAITHVPDDQTLPGGLYFDIDMSERAPAQLVAGDIVLDRKRMRLWRGGDELALELTQFRLLEFLMRHRGAVFTRGELSKHLRGDIVLSDRAIDVYIHRLRDRLKSGRFGDPIRTVRGFGYSFDELYGACHTAADAPRLKSRSGVELNLAQA